MTASRSCPALPLLASAHGFPHPDRPRRRGRRRHRTAAAPSRRSAGGRGAGHPARPRRAAVSLLTDDPVDRMTWHRSASHSLLVLPFVAWAIWAWFRGRGGRVAQAPRRWFWAIHAGAGHASVAGRIHRLRHAAAVAAAGAAGDVVERVHHRPALHGVAAARLRASPGSGASGRWRNRRCWPGLVLSTLYLGWSLVGQARSRTARRARAGCAGLGGRTAVLGADAVQHPAVARGGDDAEGIRRRRALTRGRSRADAASASTRPTCGAGAGASTIPAVQRLNWFNRGFMKARGARRRAGAVGPAHGRRARLQLPLRRRAADGERLAARSPPEQLQWPWEASRRLGAMWKRIWNAPEGARKRPMRPWNDLGEVPVSANGGR